MAALSFLALALCFEAAAQDGGGSAKAQALLARYTALQSQLAASPLGRPLIVESTELPGGLRGEVFALIEHPFSQVVQALGRPANWCEILMLHINNRQCELGPSPDGAPQLSLSVVRRYDHSVKSAFVLPLLLRIDKAAPDYLAITLHSDSGPMGTSQHHVMVEAVALPGAPQQTFLHFSYGYQHNALARMASQAYLSTFGHYKVGFTVVDQTSGSDPDYIRGLRGLVERNAVRYFLTVDAYLDAMGAPPARQPEQRLKNWYAATARYPRQLHEVAQETYLALKRADRAGAVAGAAKP